MEKVNLDTIKPWITKRTTELLGMEDEIVNGLIFELLNSEKVRFAWLPKTRPSKSIVCLRERSEKNGPAEE